MNLSPSIKILLEDIGFEYDDFTLNHIYGGYSITFKYSRDLSKSNDVFELFLSTEKELDYYCVGGSGSITGMKKYVYSIYEADTEEEIKVFLKKFFKKELRNSKYKNIWLK